MKRSQSKKQMLAFIAIRYLTYAFSFALSLIYSNRLGLQNRAILGFVFLEVSLITNLFTQGFGLQILKLYRQDQLDKTHLFSYLSSVTYFLITGLFIINLTLYIFLSHLDHLRTTIFFVVSIYFSIAFVSQLFYDYLLRTIQYSVVNKFLLIQNFVSIITFFFFADFVHISVFSSIFFSLSVSFLLPTVFIFASSGALLSILKNVWTSRKRFISHNHYFNDFSISAAKSFVLVIGERLDKVLVLTIFPLDTFSKVIVAQSFLLFLRPAQDLWLNHSIGIKIPERRLWGYIGVIGIVALLFVVSPVLYSEVVLWVLGAEWLLSLNVFLLLVLFELFKLYIFGKFSRTLAL
jgi:hypothetical protein